MPGLQPAMAWCFLRNGCGTLPTSGAISLFNTGCGILWHFVCIPYPIRLVQPFGDLGCECACGTVGFLSAMFPCLLCDTFLGFTMLGSSCLAFWED